VWRSTAITRSRLADNTSANLSYRDLLDDLADPRHALRHIRGAVGVLEIVRRPAKEHDGPPYLHVEMQMARECVLAKLATHRVGESLVAGLLVDRGGVHLERIHRRTCQAAEELAPAIVQHRIGRREVGLPTLGGLLVALLLDLDELRLAIADHRLRRWSHVLDRIDIALVALSLLHDPSLRISFVRTCQAPAAPACGYALRSTRAFGPSAHGDRPYSAAKPARSIDATDRWHARWQNARRPSADVLGRRSGGPSSRADSVRRPPSALSGAHSRSRGMTWSRA
jgi:hypothetical protein